MTTITAPTSPISEQVDSDGSSGVEVRVTEGQLVGELIRRPGVRDQPEAGLVTSCGSTKSCVPVAKERIGHVGDPLADEWKLQPQRDRQRPRAVDTRGLLQLVRDGVQSPVHDDDPAARARPEGDHREDEGQVPARSTGRRVSAPSTWCRRNAAGLTDGSSMNSQTAPRPRRRARRECRRGSGRSTRPGWPCRAEAARGRPRRPSVRRARRSCRRGRA